MTTPDFSMKQQLDVTGIASVLQRKKIAEIEAQQQKRAQALAETQQVIQGVSGLVSAAVENSKARQKQAMIQNLADSMAARVPNVMAPQEGPVMPDQPPLQPVSSPDIAGQNAVRASVQMDPTPWTKQLADQLIASPAERAVTAMNTQKAGLELANTQKVNGPIQPATLDLISAAHQRAGIPEADPSKFAGMTEQQAQTYLSHVEKMAPNENSISVSEKRQQYDEKMLAKLDERLNFGKSARGANGQAAASLRGIGQLDALFKGYKNDLTPQEWEEASITWARILSTGGGAASREQVKALIPASAMGNAKALQQWMSNNPTGTNQVEFAKRMQLGMEREKNYNEGYLKKETLRALDGYDNVLSRQAPEDLRQILENKGLDYDSVKAVKPKLAKKAWPDGRPQAPATTSQADPGIDGLAQMLGLKKRTN